jgi:ubiquitin carboxyl-terminal hydrolase 34
MTGMRSKINDRFEFPQIIDMSPYHVDHLRDPKQSSPPDMFELVGILVHSGTTESGHYYSYIRERPVPRAQSPTWVEFNDADVSRFDPANIPDQCFGGPNDASTFSPVRFAKAWNAYMLFYQRVEAIEAECDAHLSSAYDVPAKSPLPLDLSNRIAIENELFIRKYCLFDPAHAGFARTLLEQLRHLGKGTCSDDHVIERKAIWLALEHLDQILSRLKENAAFDRMLASLGRVIGTCARCCKLALDWINDHKLSLRNLLLRCPNTKTRKDFSEMLLTALKYLRRHEPRLYGFDVDEVERKLTDSHLPETSGALQGVVSGLKELWITMHQQFRAWDDYFGLLVEIASLGTAEAHVVLREDFLKLSFDILLLDYTGARRLKHENPHYANIVRLMEKGRKFSLTKLIELIRVLLGYIDLGLRSQELRNGNRWLENGKMALTAMEETYMRFSPDQGRSRNLVFLNKIIESEQNIKAARDIVRLMVLAEPAANTLGDISKTILGGISIEPASLASPYLAAALAFCETCHLVSSATNMVTKIAHEVETIGLHGGKEHLDFFTQARRLQSPRTRSPQFFSRLVLQNVPYWAPPLVMYWEECVRIGTIELLKTLVFDHDIQNMDDEQHAQEIERIAKALCRACVKRIQDQIITPRRSVEIRSVESVSMIIKHCIQTYYQVEESEAEHEMVLEAEGTVSAHLDLCNAADFYNQLFSKPFIP